MVGADNISVSQLLGARYLWSRPEHTLLARLFLLFKTTQTHRKELMHMTLFTNACMFDNGRLIHKDAVLADGALSFFAAGSIATDAADTVFHNCYIFPGFCDVHVHLREPGFSYKETIATGTAAAARGGYTAVCSMPNLNPVPDSIEHLSEQLSIIERDAVIDVYPLGALTVGQAGEAAADLEGMAPYAIAYSDDGRGVQSTEMMEHLMRRAKALGKVVVAHCEDNSLLRGGYIHDGEYAKAHGHRGICSESEWGPIKRDLELAEKIGCAYHVCHISTKESVQLIREAKARGVNVTCETGPHYLTLCDDDLQEHGRFKMNPPLRSAADKAALIEGVKDGTIDMIATDHAPHSWEEKSRGLEKSAMGVVGLETAFPVLYTYLIKPGVVSLERIIEMMTSAPRERFNIPQGEQSFTVWQCDDAYAVDPETFVTKGRATPFAGHELLGTCITTIHGGKIVWKIK